MLKRSYIKMVKNAYNLHLDGAIVGTDTSEPANDDAVIMAMGGQSEGGGECWWPRATQWRILSNISFTHLLWPGHAHHPFKQSRG